MTGSAGEAVPWWRDAVIYQVYLRSFADGNGDGVGDIAGVRSRLPYLNTLGVDAIWITPWYPSPMADGGYDVADYRDIDPLFGTLAEAQALIDEAHGHGLRVLVDLVPNHTSYRHEWFHAALAAGPGSPERARYWFRPGRGPAGELPPNNWQSRFGGPAWTRAHDGTEWYLHLFTPEQPDLNWQNPDVHAEFESILRFWLDRGVDGFRIDVAHGLVKDPELPDLGDSPAKVPSGPGQHPHWDRDEVQNIYRAWRRVADGYAGDRAFVAEAWVDGPERLVRYVDTGCLHTTFNFDFLQCPWEVKQLRAVIDTTLNSHADVGAPPTWVLSNHDVIRHVTRYGRARTALADAWQLYGTPVDLGLGTRRARAAALLTLALPGNSYVYQGDELGLWEVEDLPEHVLQDPARLRSNELRDGSRVPLPWAGTRPPLAFSDASAQPWLPQPADWASLTVEAQQRDPSSTLTLYRTALRLRRELIGRADQSISWVDGPADTLVFDRSADWRCVVNLGTEPAAIGGRIILTSDPVNSGALPPDTAAWINPLEPT